MAYDVIVEDVPRFQKRIGDHVLAGSNNSVIVLGTDRETDHNTGYGHINAESEGKGSGAIYAVVGRNSENPSLKDDLAYLYLSMKTDPDKNAGTENIGKNVSKKPGAILKADCVRIIARDSLKIKVGFCYLTLEASGAITIDGEIKLGKNAVERIIKGEAFKQFFALHKHPTAVGLSGPPVDLVPESIFSSRKVLVE